MIRTMITTVSNLVFFVSILAQMVHSQARYEGQTIEQIISLPEDSIDLGIACLVLAKDAYPNLNVGFFDYAIDFMAKRIQLLNKDLTDPEARIGLLNTYFFRPGWWNDSITFTYDLDDLEATRKENQFLNGYIASKKGSCATMSMLYLVLADRLGWPIKAVRSGKHVYCRYIQEGFKENNIEATCGGGYLADDDYVKQVGIPKKAIKNGVYLRTLTKKEYIATLLQNNVRYFRETKKDLDKSIYYCRLSLSIDSTLSTAYWNLGQLYREKAIELDSIRFERIQSLRSQSYVQRNVAPEVFPQSSAHSVPPQPLTMDQYIESLKPNPHTSFYPRSNPMKATPETQRENEQGILGTEIQSLDMEYGKQIQELLQRSRQLKAKAKALGIVLKFPEEFFIKQANAIEEFKRTGKY